MCTVHAKVSKVRLIKEGCDIWFNEFLAGVRVPTNRKQKVQHEDYSVMASIFLLFGTICSIRFLFFADNRSIFLIVHLCRLLSWCPSFFFESHISKVFQRVFLLLFKNVEILIGNIFPSMNFYISYKQCISQDLHEDPAPSTSSENPLQGCFQSRSLIQQWHRFTIEITV